MHDELLRELYPALGADELKIVKENLDRYLEIAWDLMEEMQGADHGP